MLTHSGYYSWEFYLSPRKAWEAMYQDCARAVQSIELEQYILENDVIGQKFMALFAEKAKQGVKVYIICDSYGSRTLANSPCLEKLRACGGQFYFYHALGPLGHLWPWRWFPRTHNKTLLVDSTVAYTGGVCIADRMIDWRDTQIRITGPVVTQVRRAFDRIEYAILHKKSIKALKTQKLHEEFIYLQSYPIVSWHIIYHELTRAMNHAERYIYLSTAFFAPNRRFRSLLLNARKKGVEVMLLVPQKSDVAIVDWLCLSYANQLLRAGIRIFRYQHTVLHNKTVIIDDRWATIGSTNLDVLSFFRNRESNLIFTNTKAVAELKGQFLSDIRHSEELTLNLLRSMPLWKKGIGYLVRMLKSFL